MVSGVSHAVVCLVQVTVSVQAPPHRAAAVAGGGGHQLEPAHAPLAQDLYVYPAAHLLYFLSCFFRVTGELVDKRKLHVFTF